MKKLLTVILFCSLLNTGFAQVIEIDVNNRTVKNDTVIEENKKVEIKLVNFNPYSLDVVIDGKYAIKNPVPPNIFSFITAPATPIANAPITRSLFVDDIGAQGEGITDPDGSNSSENESECIYPSNEKVDELILYLKYFNGKYDLIKQLYSEVLKPVIDKDSIDILVNKKVASYYEDNGIKISETDKKKLNALELKGLIFNYNKFKSQLLEIETNEDIVKCTVNGKYAQLATLIKEFKNEKIETQIYKSEDLLKSLPSIIQSYESGFIVKTFIAKGDEIELNIAITPNSFSKRFENPFIPFTTTKIFKVKSDWKTNFSSGLIFTYGHENQKYAVKTTESQEGSIFNVIEEGESKFDYGISATINFLKQGEKIDFGPIVGFGYLPRNSNLLLLGGIGIATGEKKNLLFSIGLSAGFVKTLSDSLDEALDYSAAPVISTKSDISIAPFFSFSYQLKK